LGQRDFVISTDEKTGIQARKRLAPTTAASAGRPGRVEHEYERQGALAYLFRMSCLIRGRRDRLGLRPFRASLTERRPGETFHARR